MACVYATTAPSDTALSTGADSGQRNLSGTSINLSMLYLCLRFPQLGLEALGKTVDQEQPLGTSLENGRPATVQPRRPSSGDSLRASAPDRLRHYALNCIATHGSL